jgi:tellurite methyltransferase
MSSEDCARWDRKWRSREGADEVPAWLKRHASLLVGGGVAVDLATGRGASARFLAQHDYQVLAVDISLVALRQAHAAARAADKPSPPFVQGDLDAWRFPARSVGVVTVFRFLDRELFPHLRQVLRPGGLLFYETRTVGWLEREPAASPRFLLGRGELLRLAAGMAVLAYLESRYYAALVAQQT